MIIIMPFVYGLEELGNNALALIIKRERERERVIMKRLLYLFK